MGISPESPITFEWYKTSQWYTKYLGLRDLHRELRPAKRVYKEQREQLAFKSSLRSRASDPAIQRNSDVARGRNVSVPSFRERGLHT